MTSSWESVGAKLRQSPRRQGPDARDLREMCEGCGHDVTRGTLRNVLVDRSQIGGTDPRTGNPLYRFEAFKALCIRCREGIE